jgi:hypothetical protein
MLSGLRPDEFASASGLSNFVSTMSGSFATAVTVWVWNRRSDYHHAVLTEHVRDSAVRLARRTSHSSMHWACTASPRFNMSIR